MNIICKIRENDISELLRKVLNKVAPYPKGIGVEIMTVCNLKCKHCRVNIIDVEPQMMELNFFKQIVDRISPIIKKVVTFQFSTIEPFFHPQLFAMMDYVSKYNKYISYPLLTNGMLLNDKNIASLCSRRVPSVTVSLDGCKQETVESFKTGAKFDKIINNIKILKKMDKPKVNTIFVATSLNIGELVDYVDFCADLGINRIFVNGFLSYLPELSHLSFYSKEGNLEVRKVFLKANERAKKRDISIQFPHLVTARKRCDNLSHMYIGENGNVSPCIHLARKTPLALMGEKGVTIPIMSGNVFKENPVHIWSRLAKSRSEPMSACRLCAEAHGVIVSKSSALKDLL
ncbi:MAG: radical SAM protein [Candidatus Omnitrophica bacterium]|nr:radical SAM protein [Candidatus Omnitrophota bacterium]